MKQTTLQEGIFEEEDDTDIVLENAIQEEFTRTVLVIERQESDSSICVNPYPKAPSEPIVLTQPPSKPPKDKPIFILSSFILVPLILIGSGAVVVGIKMAFNQEKQRNYWFNMTIEKLNKESLSKKKSKSLFHSKEYQHSMLLEDIGIPIFLDDLETNNMDFIGALSKCLALNSTPVQDYMNKIYQNISPKFDFLTVKALCGFHRHYYRRLKFFKFIQNPVLRFVQHYNEITDPSSSLYDEKFSNLKNFSEYLDWSLHVPYNNNILTRSILCKEKGNLEKYDLDKAKAFLNERVYVGDSKDYIGATKMFKNIFNWDSVSSDECIESSLQKYTSNQARILQSPYIGNEHLKKIYEANLYDFSIYFDYVKDESF